MGFHSNTGKCDGCQKIFDRYPGFYAPLKSWFELLQSQHPEAHISCAGRGQMDQEALFQKKATRARWKQSAHNYNCAIDLFELGGKNKSDLYEKAWFDSVVKPAVLRSQETCGVDLTWYGMPGSSFFELPHIEVKGWSSLNGLQYIGFKDVA